MNQHSPLRSTGSLLERAAELYGFGAHSMPAPLAPPAPTTPPAPVPDAAGAAPAPVPDPVAAAPAARPRPAPARAAAGRAAVDRDGLREAGFIEPDAPGGGLAEEFRIVKRQLLLGAFGKATLDGEKARTVLVCSAQPNEGKTFCAVNLALSLAAERDVEVLLIDADFPKPEILSILGLEGGAGLVDALADPAIDPESLVIRTDVRGLSVLAAGRHVPNATELLASDRTREVLAALGRDPRRILLFDAPPALMASPASVLATHAGQLLMVVRADQTTESDLREAVALLSGCENVRLLLNGTGFAATGRRFGSYYGYGQ